MPSEVKERSGDDLIFHGFLRKDIPSELEQLINLYKKAAVFVLPSIYDPMPNITLEANYLKIPVICSNVCGIPEQVKDGYSGYVIKDNQPEKYAKKIIDLFNDPDLRYSLGSQGRKFVMENFSWNSTVNKILLQINNNLV